MALSIISFPSGSIVLLLFIIRASSKIPFKNRNVDNETLYRFSVRLNGIDTPEMKGKGVSDDEKTAAHLAQKFVSDLILNKYVKIQNIKNEKYGRILADVYIGNIHLNDVLLKERYAVPYFGDTKKKPVSWINYKQTGEM